MAARLGNVVYWLNLIIAVLAGLAGALMPFEYTNIATEGFRIYQDQKKVWRNMLPREQNYLLQKALVLSDGLRLLGVSFGRWLVGRVTLCVLAGLNKTAPLPNGDESMAKLNT